ncbi:class I adenylate-forming enzyme family protein [Natrialba swarupiae]|uniref:Long-chain fatty acid--CoA ligase n=1 Tax=Natrialba swarupiae TaxID=2448032 RepID=A0A5D5ASY7_9EURY|nr:AMP-binding protein [Natrialba swarupiae]TYT63995.1 long-chain fatty acid--CoA ligase [Natrialba swarupiae]
MTLSLARRAERFPDRTAVVDISEERLDAPDEITHEESVSYGELSRLADDLANRLSALGVDPSDTVCLVTRNRVISLGLLFACRRLGATFVPISHLLTPVTVERPFEVLEPALVVAESAQRDLVRSIPFDRPVTLEQLADVDPGDADGDSTATRSGDDSRPGLESDARDRPLLALHAEEGRPIATFTERTLEWNCISALVAWGLSSEDVAPLVTPLSVPDSLLRVALPILYVGGRLLLDRAFDPGDALTAIEDENATVLAGRKIAFRNLAAETSFATAVDSLELAIPDRSVSAEILEPYRDRGIHISRAYGRLECPTGLCQPTDAISSLRDDLPTDDGEIGLPLPDCRVRLVDGHGDVLESATTGRLQVSGPVVADGYVNAADFVDDEVDVAADADPTRADPDVEAGRFVDGWFDTGETVHRDDRGYYTLE